MLIGALLIIAQQESVKSSRKEWVNKLVSIHTAMRINGSQYTALWKDLINTVLSERRQYLFHKFNRFLKNRQNKSILLNIKLGIPLG